MRKLQYILSAIVIALSLSSCDLDTMPTDSVPDENLYTTTENVEKVLTGTWRYLWEYSTIVSSPGFHTVLLASDVMGSDIAVPNTYGYIGVYQFNIMHDRGQSWISRVWENAYKTIDNCNHIITKIDNAEGDDKDKKRIKSQALALRGYVYLSLATYYSFSYSHDPQALCVPIYTTPSIFGTPGNPRSTLEKVYERARLDLEDAYNMIDPNYDRGGSDKKWRIDKSVISGLLARLYLQMGNGYWDKAASYAAEAHSGYSWMAKADYLGGFNDVGNAEWMWGQPQTIDQNKNPFAWRDVTTPGSYSSFYADPYFMEELFSNGTDANNELTYDEGDIRYQLFEWSTNRNKGMLMYKKFYYKPETTYGDYVFMRKAEMVLVEAEALAEQDQLASAISKLNELRTARGAETPDLSSLSKEDLVEEILKERRKELWGEGFALSDIIRRQKSVVRKEYPGADITVNGIEITTKGHTATRFPDGNSFTPNSSYYLFAIPQSEYNTNPNI